MKILSIDTSSEACSASLNLDGELVTDFQFAPQKHSSLILPMCDQLLAKCELSLKQIDAVAFGVGPGSFTGLRIAAGVVQGIAFGSDLPVIKVSTLAALAQQLAPPLMQEPSQSTQVTQASQLNTKIIAAIDARMQEMYWCIYGVEASGLVTPLMNEAISSPEEVAFTDCISNNDQPLAIGSAWREFNDALRAKKCAPIITNIHESRLTSAKEIGILAAEKFNQKELVSAADAIPVYLRNNVAKKSQKIQKAL